MESELQTTMQETGFAREDGFLHFEVDSSIIKDLIFSQNGTVATAIRELVMNSIDAGSPTCQIRIGPSGFDVIDTGSGFKDRESVEKYFKRFGEPHQSGDSTYGRFRIGRGQIMAFGQVTWHSNAFKMITDINGAGVGFKFIEDEHDNYSGCRVSGIFYNQLSDGEAKYVSEEIRELVRYAPQDITINGLKITESDDSWDYEDDDLKIKWDPARGHGVFLYSLGIFVKEISSYQYGISADVVTKKALQLNMARNEISDKDTLWRKITGLLKERTLELGNRSEGEGSHLDEMTRKSIIRQVVDLETELCDIVHIPLIRDYRGHKVTLESLASHRNRPLIIAPESGNRICERLATSRTAMVLHHEELRIWRENSLQSLITSLVNYLSHGHNDKSIWRLRNRLSLLNIQSYEVLAAAFSDHYELIQLKVLTARERAARSALEYASGTMARRLSAFSPVKIIKRSIKAGDSQVADAWTDGSSYIAVSRHMLPLLDLGYSGAVQLAMLLLHEYCHDTQDSGSHEHSFEFYEKYHSLSSQYLGSEIIGHTANSIYNRYNDLLAGQGLALSEHVKRVFRAPVVNDVHEYIGEMDGTKSLSPLSSLILAVLRGNSAKTTLTVRKTVLHLTLPAQMEKDFSSRDLRRALFNAIESDGFTLPDRNEVLARYLELAPSGSYDQSSILRARAELRRLRRQVLSDWCKRFDHDFNVADQLLIGWHFTVADLLCIICQDTNSGLKSFEMTTLTKVKVRGGADYNHKIYSNSISSGNGWEWGERSLSASKEKRYDFALAAILDIVNGMVNQNERREFIEAFFHENLAIQCRRTE